MRAPEEEEEGEEEEEEEEDVGIPGESERRFPRGVRMDGVVEFEV